MRRVGGEGEEEEEEKTDFIDSLSISLPLSPFRHSLLPFLSASSPSLPPSPPSLPTPLQVIIA